MGRVVHRPACGGSGLPWRAAPPARGSGDARTDPALPAAAPAHQAPAAARGGPGGGGEAPRPPRPPPRPAPRAPRPPRVGCSGGGGPLVGGVPPPPPRGPRAGPLLGGARDRHYRAWRNLELRMG